MIVSRRRPTRARQLQACRRASPSSRRSESCLAENAAVWPHCGYERLRAAIVVLAHAHEANGSRRLTLIALNAKAGGAEAAGSQAPPESPQRRRHLLRGSTRGGRQCNGRSSRLFNAQISDKAFVEVIHQRFGRRHVDRGQRPPSKTDMPLI